MEQKKNLCAQIPLSLHDRVTEAREESGLTTAQYITNLLIEYFEMKENGGKVTMATTNTRTLAFQIDEELFQRIKAHLERESARLGRKVTQREFVLNAIIGVLNMSEPMDVDEAGVSPCEAQPEGGDTQPQEDGEPAVWGT
ncbi:translation initiation factor 2 [Oscillospiraceae bacterium 38-13]